MNGSCNSCPEFEARILGQEFLFTPREQAMKFCCKCVHRIILKALVKICIELLFSDKVVHKIQHFCNLKQKQSCTRNDYEVQAGVLYMKR